jgi:hypothetical protein
MAEERFNVIYFDEEGYWEYALRDVPAQRAVEKAKRMIEIAIEDDNDIDRIIITDSGDMTTFQWERGKGVVFPTRADVAT